MARQAKSEYPQKKSQTSGGPNRRGRPVTAAGPRPILITLRLYPHEHERLKRAAATAGLSLSAYLRQV